MSSCPGSQPSGADHLSEYMQAQASPESSISHRSSRSLTTAAGERQRYFFIFSHLVALSLDSLLLNSGVVMMAISEPHLTVAKTPHLGIQGRYTRPKAGQQWKWSSDEPVPSLHHAKLRLVLL